MRFLLFILYMGMVTLPASIYAQVVSVDPTGTAQTATEAGNTANNVAEGATQVSQYQKTMAAIGTYKETVSSYMSKVNKYKEKALKQKEKMDKARAKYEKYKKDVNKARADYEKYKKEAQSGIDMAKNSKNMINGAIDSAKSSVNSIKSQAQGMVDDAKGMAESTVGNVSGQKSSSGENASASNEESGGETGSASSSSSSEAAGQAVASASKETDRQSVSYSSGGTVGTTGGGASSGAMAVSKAGSSGGVVGSTQGQGSIKQTASNIVDEPTAQPSRRPLIMDEAATAERVVQNMTKDNVLTQNEPVSAMSVEKASIDKAMAISTSNVAEKLSVQSEVAGAAAKAKASAGVQAERTINDAIANKAISAESAEMLPEHSAAVKEVQPAIAEKDMLIKENVKNIKSDSINRIKRIKDAVTPAKKIELHREDTQIEINKTHPRRAVFKTSSGYGHISQSIPLAFADQMGGNQMGEFAGTEAMDDTLISSSAIGMFCEMDYKAAAEGDTYDTCLKKINELRYSELNKELETPLKTFSGQEKTSISTVDRDQAEKEIIKGYAELIASAYLEALESYNDSLTFKENTVDPVLNQDFPKEKANFKYLYQITEIVGERINRINKLWARLLLVDAYQPYVYDGIRTSDDALSQTSTN